MSNTHQHTDQTTPPMNADSFKKTTAEQGFSEPVVVERAADGWLDVHSHPFEAKALILQGQIEIGWGDERQTYKTGDVFHLQAGHAHWERYGPAGVVYLSARKDLA